MCSFKFFIQNFQNFFSTTSKLFWQIVLWNPFWKKLQNFVWLRVWRARVVVANLKEWRHAIIKAVKICQTLFLYLSIIYDLKGFFAKCNLFYIIWVFSNECQNLWLMKKWIDSPKWYCRTINMTYLNSVECWWVNE